MRAMPGRRLSITAVIATIMIVLAWATGCSSYTQLRSRSPANRLRLGEYLREDYIQALCSTLSPLKATRADEFPQLIRVARDENGISFMPSHNFHEGDEPYHLTKDGVVKQSRAVLPQALGQLLVYDTEAFSLRKAAEVYRFRFVQDAERWVSSVVVAGAYRDQSGAEYVFNRNGRALFPGQKPFSYALGLDHVLTDHDDILSSDLKKSWAAFITPRGLTLYNESGDVGEVVSSTPHWILTRLTAPACKQP